jgi:hypothetical protein
MEAINIFLFILAIATFGLSFFIFWKNKKNALNISFGALVSTGGLWALSIAFFRSADNLKYAFLWNKIIYVSATLRKLT